MFGVNQAECCSGETAENGPLTADVVASAGAPNTRPGRARRTSS
jgi:hypothetical protein